MDTGRSSKTALRVAIRRAAHQLVDRPPVLDDPIAARMVGPGFARDMERAGHHVARDFRSLMAVRSRFVEDELAEAVARGVRQYVILGAGLDTFAWRNPFPDVRVFEVDFPATQDWKQAMLERAGLARPERLTFVPLDFEKKGLRTGLSNAGLDAERPAFFSMLGVIPYLTLETFRTMLRDIAGLPTASGVGFDYGLSPDGLEPERRLVLKSLAKKVAAAGEPFKLYLTARDTERELGAAGFVSIDQWDSGRLNRRYFHERNDGLKLKEPGVWMLASARVGAALF